MSKKRMNTLGTILDTSGSVPKGKTGGGFARNEPRPVKAKTTEGQKTLDKLSDAIEEAKNSKTGQKLTELADKADKLLAKGDIEALQKLSASIDGLLDKGAQASGGNPAALAGLALAFALKEVFLPTNILEIIPVGKIVTKGRKVVKVLKKTEKAADGLKLAEKSAKAGKKGSKGGHVKGKAKSKNPCAHKRDKIKKKYVVYRAKLKDNSGYYVGRTSGQPGMDTEKILAKRKSGHHRKDIGMLEKIFETDSYSAVRGAEQVYKDKMAKMGKGAKQIEPISKKNKNKNNYLDCAKIKGVH